MIRHIKMPKYGLQQDEGTLVRWLKQEGDQVSRGEIICEVETDKALFDFEAPNDGFLRKILCEEDQTVPVLSDIAILADTADEPIDSETVESEPTAEAPAQAASSAPAPESTPAPAESAAAHKVRRSPAARKLAEELDIDLATVTGTGPDGRIKKEDVQAAADALISTADAAPVQGNEQLTKMRQAIGKAMVASKQTIPHFYLSIDVDMTEVERAWKEARDESPDLTLTDIIVRAAAYALTDFPILNAFLEDDTIVYNEHVNVGLAVGTDDGLLVPVITSAESKSLAEMTRIRSEVVAAARKGKLISDAQATVTVSNLGMFGIREFAAIINPPECASIAIGAIRDEVRPTTDPVGFAARRVMTVTLSADHRLVDGLVCARYLQALQSRLEVASWL